MKWSTFENIMMTLLNLCAVIMLGFCLFGIMYSAVVQIITGRWVMFLLHLVGIFTGLYGLKEVICETFKMWRNS
jgi:hypothetical protein